MDIHLCRLSRVPRAARASYINRLGQDAPPLLGPGLRPDAYCWIFLPGLLPTWFLARHIKVTLTCHAYAHPTRSTRDHQNRILRHISRQEINMWTLDSNSTLNSTPEDPFLSHKRTKLSHEVRSHLTSTPTLVLPRAHLLSTHTRFTLRATSALSLLLDRDLALRIARPFLLVYQPGTLNWP
ncbi:hypothetical protein PROFUN_02731 [Planoprotostelium fungivorum]|uniref:Uncharacterized protein n=1 Tax=Planoprotostelium fungivorum TaxID=1890364 RepID=A0A2P6NXE2_9EUKA|nr:hypothetical protein PROFUN_02731 [Planoprotostelium fungivorum]